MSYTACTMFEGHYHYGVAVLVNSLYNNGYKGDFYIGYRGGLPEWIMDKNKSKSAKNKDGTLIVTFAEDLTLYFIELNTSIHFSNFKPQFMQQVLNVDSSYDHIYYFDPDIVVKENWNVFLSWADAGIAVCEDVNSPIQRFHPKRIKWRELYKKENYELKFKSSIYVNSGFLGLSRKQYDFLNTWINSLYVVSKHIGGLEKASFKGKNHISLEMQNDYSPFSKTDQDGLNVALEMCDFAISYMGKEGMSFGPGPRLMSHALGAKKPWLFEPFKEIVAGVPPRQVDKDFWENATFPINVYDASFVKSKKTKVKIASLIGRFYKRN